MNKFAYLAVAAITAASFNVAGALAQAGGDFAKADANNDGFVSLEEAMGVYPTLTPDLFAKADADGDGKLDPGELATLQGLTAGLATNTKSPSGASSAASSSSGG